MHEAGYYSERVANSITAMLAYWDKDQVCRFANHAYLHWFGVSASEMINKITLKELLGPLYAKNLPYIEEAYRGKVQVFEREITTPDGTRRQSIATYTPDIVDGEVQGIIVHVADVSRLKGVERELQQAKERAEELATHDYLTGLPNRVLLMDRIVNGISLAERKGYKIAVCMMDIDHFKSFNDHFGHLEGDNVLKEIAARSKATLRESESLSRLGGDEFVMLLLDVETREQIERAVKRIFEITKMPIVIRNACAEFTLSFGIAIYPEDGKTPETLLANADKALYQSKESGRNSISYYR